MGGKICEEYPLHFLIWKHIIPTLEKINIFKNLKAEKKFEEGRK